MRLKITHKTTYSFDAPVHYALQQVRLTPKKRPGQTIVSWSIEMKGGQEEVSYDDEHNNRVILFNTDAGADHFELEVTGTVDTSATSGVLGRHGGHAPLWLFDNSTPLTTCGKGVQVLTKLVRSKGLDPLDQLHALSEIIRSKVIYEIGATSTATSAEDAIEAGVGVCQDHTHVFLSAARKLGYPARYVSGYLMLDDRVEQDATHAWAEAHLEGIGWVGFDISNGISPDERYVAVATGLDYLQTSPISGMRFGQGTESMVVSLQVQQ